MPKFKSGSPQIVFFKRNGKKFTKTFHSISSAKKAKRGWTSAGGKIARVKRFRR